MEHSTVSSNRPEYLDRTIGQNLFDVYEKIRANDYYAAKDIFEHLLATLAPEEEPIKELLVEGLYVNKLIIQRKLPWICKVFDKGICYSKQEVLDIVSLIQSKRRRLLHNS